MFFIITAYLLRMGRGNIVRNTLNLCPTVRAPRKTEKGNKNEREDSTEKLLHT